MTAVHGKDVVIYIYRTDDVILLARPIACASNCTMNYNIELIETATVDSGRENDYEAGFIDCDISVDGIVTLDEIPMWQIKEFIDKIGVKLLAIFEMTND